MKLFIVDDDPGMLRLLGRLVEAAGHEWQGFGSVAAFRASLPSLAFGCVLLDVTMPDGCGLDLLSELHRWPVIMVSGTTDVDHAIAAFRGGAVQFLRKPFSRVEFGEALAAAARVADARLAAVAREQAARSVSLTGREREVLCAMDRGEQSKVIAWNLGLSRRTVDMHRTNILGKLSARNAVHAVAIARDLGLLVA